MKASRGFAALAAASCRVSLGGFWLNAGSKDEVFVAAIGVAF